MPTTRCYNCGLPGHQTEACPSYGPRFPAPGKSGQDYADKAQEIRNLIAMDIINEHNADHSEDPDVEEAQARQRAERRVGRARAKARSGADDSLGDTPVGGS